MASKSEVTFGARLLRAQNLLNYISNFSNYAPPRTEESSSGFRELLNNITAINTEGTMLQQQYNTAVTNRAKAFRKEEGSVAKLLAPIRAAVLAQYGKKSLEFKQANTLVKKIRDAKLIVKPATETTPETTISQSEQSYGSVTQAFSDLVTILAQLPGYNSSNPQLQVTSLQSFVGQLHQFNAAVAIHYQQFRNCRNKRRALYEELSDRANRIKAYVKANYGMKSSEFTLVKGMKI